MNQNTPSPMDIDVGARLREIRAERGVSIRALAEKSGLNVNTISLIENGKSSPSVSTLQQAAAALDVPITAFFELPESPERIVYLQAGNQRPISFAQGDLLNLGSGFSRQGLKSLLITLQPGAEHDPTPIIHTGVEFVYCLAGEVNYVIEGQDYLLKPGDSLIFEASLPHCWNNMSNTSAQMLLLMCSEDPREQPTQLHFQENME